MKLIPFALVVISIAVFRSPSIGDPLETKIAPVGEEPVASDTVTRTEWDIFLDALIYVESSGRAEVVGSKNDVGILQITPVYVAEVNRILGEERYGLSDRTDPAKSIEMFTVLQNHHNPTHDIDRAIALHNPGAGAWYRDRILRRMDKIRDIN